MSVSQELRSVLWSSSAGLREHSLWANKVHDDEMPNESSLDGSVCPSGCLLPVGPSNHQNIHPVVRPSIKTLMFLALNACLFLPTYLPVGLSVRPSTYLLLVGLSVRQSTYLPTHPSVRPPTHLPTYSLHVPMYLYNPTYQ